MGFGNIDFDWTQIQGQPAKLLLKLEGGMKNHMKCILEVTV